MSAQPHAGISPSHEHPERRILADLARVHRLSWLTDSEGHVQWASDGWRALCGNDLARSTPLLGAARLMVWNITKDKITERMAVITEEAWSVAGIKPPPKREKPPTSEFTPAILAGQWDVSDVQGKLIKDYADEHGVDLSKIMEQSKKN